MAERPLASSRRARQRSGPCSRLQEAAMLISDVLRTKGHHVVRIHTVDSVELAVRKLAEHRIGALVVEDRWMKPVGIFSERDFINAMARDGAATLGLASPTTDVDAHPQLSLLRSRGCCACDNDDSADPSPAGYRGQRAEGHREYR